MTDEASKTMLVYSVSRDLEERLKPFDERISQILNDAGLGRGVWQEDGDSLILSAAGHLPPIIKVPIRDLDGTSLPHRVQDALRREKMDASNCG